MTAAEWSAGAAGPVLRLAGDGPEAWRDLALCAGPSWRDLAVCAEVDPDLWFPEKGGSTEAAKRICAACPSRVPCLEYALEHDIRFGVWGGLSELERRPIRRKRKAAA